MFLIFPIWADVGQEEYEFGTTINPVMHVLAY